MSDVFHYRLLDMCRKTHLSLNLSKKTKPKWQYNIALNVTNSNLCDDQVNFVVPTIFPQITKISESGYPKSVEYYCKNISKVMTYDGMKTVTNAGMINTSMFRQEVGMSVSHSGQK